MDRQSPIMLFDGECALCNAAVQFVLDHEQTPIFRFAPLQSTVGKQYLFTYGLPTDSFDSYVVIDNHAVYVKSRAVVKMGFYMGRYWQVLSYIVKFSPRFIADGIYTFGFNRRLKWFGKHKHCRLLKPEQCQRFLDLGDSSFRAE